ncbi:MAG: hypothetical protein HUU21_38095 [Polyangiaceae bacterium]|nr:hypothetical protein [Polyangiaceae bacterium]
MYTIQRNVGRLVEAVMQARVTREDIDAAGRAIAEVAQAMEGQGVVIGDYRATKFLLEEDVAALLQVLRRYNDRIERSAILVSERSAVGVLQMERMVRESGHPLRRAFRDVHEAAAWLSEVLTPEERARLHLVLGISEAT